MLLAENCFLVKSYAVKKVDLFLFFGYYRLIINEMIVNDHRLAI
jgi:hypothetical protein